MAQESASLLIGRALRKCCPVCGNGAVFASHFHMNRACPACHAIFWKDPGESLGAMYLDYAVAAGAFLICWAILDWTTTLSDLTQLVILCVIAVGSVLLCFPYTRSAWTVLVYISGGIERPQLRVIRGGKDNSHRAA
ncbi:MAG TPA: DUF983 domain-containing protein [Candidatus Binataceae bacterium]|nr:DUF983 domain-containing protein [Candidatus Binataceae bacterium]